METTLRDLCQQHGLTTISVMHQYEPHNYTSVYLHWKEEGETVCVSGGGKTFDDGLAMAVAHMTARRDAQKAVA